MLKFYYILANINWVANGWTWCSYCLSMEYSALVISSLSECIYHLYPTSHDLIFTSLQNRVSFPTHFPSLTPPPPHPPLGSDPLWTQIKGKIKRKKCPFHASRRKNIVFFFWLVSVAGRYTHTHTHVVNADTSKSKRQHSTIVHWLFQVLSSESHLIYMKRADDPLWKRCVCVWRVSRVFHRRFKSTIIWWKRPAVDGRVDTGQWDVSVRGWIIEQAERLFIFSLSESQLND